MEHYNNIGQTLLLILPDTCHTHYQRYLKPGQLSKMTLL